MQGRPSPLSTGTSTPPTPTPPADVALSNTISGLLVIVLPAVVVCTILVHRKCREMILQRRIQRLNRLWQLDSSRKLS